jgi:hypothetical protein
VFETARRLAVTLVPLIVFSLLATQLVQASSAPPAHDEVKELSSTSNTRRVFFPLIKRDFTVADSGQIPPPSRAVYWGAYVDRVPFEMNKLDEFERMAGKKAAIVHFGIPWHLNGSWRAFPTAEMDALRARGSIPMINWGSWNLGGGPEQPAFQLVKITRGRYDKDIRAWARQAKAWGHPFFLKFNHEMDGRWQFPWSVQLNGNKPEDFVPMWRHVHDIFRQEGVTNVTWVWCPTTKSNQSIPFEQLYPGDAYVDWTCIHGYNFGGDDWRPFNEIFSGHALNPNDSYGDMVRLAPTKPIMIGEWASAEAGDGGTRKAAWIQDALTVHIPNRYPNIRAVVWFNYNAHEGRTWEIQSSQRSINAFKSAIASPVYPSNQFSRLTASPIPPPTR